MTLGDPAAGAAGRTSTATGRLARLGFADAQVAARTLDNTYVAGLLVTDDRLLGALSGSADPDAALAGLVGVVDAAVARDRTALLAALADPDGPVLDRLVSVLGASVALADHLARHPDHWVVLGAPSDLPPGLDEARRELLVAVGAAPDDPEPIAVLDGQAGYEALRQTYRRRLLMIAARDLTGLAGFEPTAAALAELASATLEAALAIARSELPPGSEPCRLAVVAMGKCGGLELNYVSDVDVLFVAEPLPDGDETAALVTATRLATGLMRACSASTAEGEIWPVDAGLRPEGRQGALVRTLASYSAYYDRWASTWEFQALLKARPAAGDLALGEAFVDAMLPQTWGAADRPHFVEDVQAMRRRVEEHVPVKEAERQLKLGRGGLRDVEFAVQLLQLVHGRSDVFVRSPSTLLALEQLSTRGYVGRDDAAELDRAYRFLRTLEHRLQLHRLRRTHVVPDDDVELRRLARSMGYTERPIEELMAEWRRHRREVRRLHEKLFYRPLLNAVARLEADEARLTPEAALDRLEALGYADPEAALRHIEALTSGVTRRAAIQRTLLPVMLAWFAEHPDPDAGLLGFRQVSDALGTTPWYLRLLRDDSAVAERMARILATSRYATDLLLRAPEAVRLLGDDGELTPRPVAALITEMLAAAGRKEDPTDAIAAVRAVRRRELFRVASADLVGAIDVDVVGEALSDIAAATLHGGLAAAVRAVERQRGSPLPTKLLVVGMGRLGGHELGYGSDADVLFVHQPHDGADEREAQDAAHAVVGELRRLLALPAPDPPMEVDADLRPEGRQGPLVRTLASYAAYYARWSLTWEAQALLRAEPVVGDPELAAAFRALVDPLRWPEGGLSDTDVREVRRIKARVEAERLPRGADATLHTKLGRGGLSDVEWTVQLIQLQHASSVVGLRTTRTLGALSVAVDAGLVEPADAAVLAEAWRTATRVRNATMLVRGRASDTLPVDVRELAGVARVVGYAPGRTGDLVEDYRRTTRRARGVVGKSVLRVTESAERDPSLLRRAFDHSEVRALLLAEAFSDLGDQIARVALALLVFERTDSVFAAALTLAVAYLPGIFGSAVLGSLADRLPRRAVLLWCDLLRAFLIALLALVAVDGTPLVVLLLLLLASEFVAAPFTSARTALFGDILADRDLYSAALTIGRSVNLTAQVIGFLAGGLVVGWLGPRMALAVDAVTFLISYAVIRARVTSRGAADEAGTSARRLLVDMAGGFREVMEDRSRRAMVLFGWASALFLIAPEAVAVGYSLDQPAWVSGLLLASVPAGSALGALLLGRLPLPRQTELLLPLAALSCLPLFATSVDPPPAIAVLMWFVAGIFQAYVITVIASITYLTAPGHRGRVMGVAASGFNAATALSFLIVGWLAEVLDPARAVSLAGAAGLIVVAIAYAVWPSRVVT